jgi:hypothetical protein
VELDGSSWGIDGRRRRARRSERPREARLLRAVTASAIAARSPRYGGNEECGREVGSASAGFRGNATSIMLVAGFSFYSRVNARVCSAFLFYEKIVC